MCAGAGTSVSSRFSVNSSNRSGRSRNRFPSLSLFLSLFWVFGGSPDRHFALLLDLMDVLDESCGSDVEDELELEFDDNPGSGVASDRWPSHRYIRVLSRASK